MKGAKKEASYDSVDDLVFEGVSSELSTKTVEMLDDLSLEMSLYDLERGEHILRVLPRDHRSVIIQPPKGVRGYIKGIQKIDSERYAVSFTIGNAMKGGEGKDCLKVRRYDDQFTIHFFTDHDEAKEYSDYKS